MGNVKSIGTVLTLAVALVLGACGSSDIGEECDHEGRVGGECVDGAVCGRSDSGSLVCLKQCSSPADCGAGEVCGPVVATTLKGCRAKKP